MFTDWHLTPERFQSVWGSWDVAAAKRILVDTPRPSTVIEIAEHTPLLSTRTITEDGWEHYTAGVDVDHDKVEADETDIDLTVPLLITAGGMLIDGWHRLARARHLGIDTLPAILLTPEETTTIAA